MSGVTWIVLTGAHLPRQGTDTAIIVRVSVLDATKNGCKSIVVRTVDTDILVILIGQFGKNDET